MGFHYESVSDLARTFGRVPAEMAAGLRAELPAVGAELMAVSQANSSWSSRIPGAHFIRARVSQSGGVEVGVDQGDAPHARPYEGLSAGGSGGEFRHPVYGPTETRPDPPWVPEATRPFLRPAAEAVGPQLEDRIRSLVQRVTA